VGDRRQNYKGAETIKKIGPARRQKKSRMSCDFVRRTRPELLIIMELVGDQFRYREQSSEWKVSIPNHDPVKN
jgi:hypothetical protein